MRRYDLAAVLLAASFINPAVATAQERPASRAERPAIESEVPRADPAEERDALRGATTTTTSIAAGVVTNATAVPAADVSAGEFGANTGGGRYYFPDRVGIGTTSPSGSLSILNGPFGQEAVGSSTYGSNFARANGTVSAKTIVANGDVLGLFKFYGWDGSAYRFSAQIAVQVDGSPGATDMPGRLAFFTSPDGSASLQERMRITNAGNVGIGTTAPAYRLHVAGDAFVSGTLSGGNIQATYQDIAEWVPSTIDLEPGTVVVLNPGRTNEVMPSASPYDTSVAGVVSEQPGLTLGIAGENKEMIATTGRVRVRVDASKAPIQIGDLLVTSERSGYAMKSVPMEIGGRRFHQPGTIIGKALENLEGGEGSILVLLSLQ